MIKKSWQASGTLTGLGEESVESIVTATDGLVRGHLAIGLDPVLQAVELPARVTLTAVVRRHSEAESRRQPKKIGNVSVGIYHSTMSGNVRTAWILVENTKLLTFSDTVVFGYFL